jgi:hypothetical protein
MVVMIFIELPIFIRCAAEQRAAVMEKEINHE